MKKGWNGLFKVLEIPYKALTQLYKKLALSYRHIQKQLLVNDLHYFTKQKRRIPFLCSIHLILL